MLLCSWNRRYKTPGQYDPLLRLQLQCLSWLTTAVPSLLGPPRTEALYWPPPQITMITSRGNIFKGRRFHPHDCLLRANQDYKKNEILFFFLKLQILCTYKWGRSNVSTVPALISHHSSWGPQTSLKRWGLLCSTCTTFVTRRRPSLLHLKRKSDYRPQMRLRHNELSAHEASKSQQNKSQIE